MVRRYTNNLRVNPPPIRGTSLFCIILSNSRPNVQKKMGKAEVFYSDQVAVGTDFISWVG